MRRGRATIPGPVPRRVGQLRAPGSGLRRGRASAPVRRRRRRRESLAHGKGSLRIRFAAPARRRHVLPAGAGVLLRPQQRIQARRAPADAVEPFAEHVVRPRREVVVLPPPQAVSPAAARAPFRAGAAGRRRGLPPVAAHGGHRRRDAAARAFQPRPLHGSRGARRGQLLPPDAGADVDGEAARRRLRTQLGDGARLLADHPARGQRHAPAAGRTDGLGAVEEGVGAPAGLVVLDPPPGDLPIDGLEHGALRVAHPRGHLRAAADDVQRAPGEERGHRVEVRAERLAAEPGRLEGHAAAAAEGVADARRTAEAPPPQLPQQLRQAGRRRAEVRVDRRPGLRRRPVHVLRPVAPDQLFVVAQPVEDEALQPLPVRRGQALPQPGPVRAGAGREPRALLRRSQAPPDLAERDGAALAPPQTLVVHGEQRQEDLAVAAGVAGGGHQQPQQDRAHQDQRLAAPPLAEAGQGLAVVGLALLVALLRQPRDGELRLDEAGAGRRGPGRGMRPGIRRFAQRDEAGAGRRGAGRGARPGVRPRLMDRGGRFGRHGGARRAGRIVEQAGGTGRRSGVGAGDRHGSTPALPRGDAAPAGLLAPTALPRHGRARGGAHRLSRRRGGPSRTAVRQRRARGGTHRPGTA